MGAVLEILGAFMLVAALTCVACVAIWVVLTILED